MKIKKSLIKLSIIVWLISLCGCKTNLGIELNKAISSDDITYGYSIDNPIIVKFKGVSSDSLIHVYVSRLARNGNMTSYHIIKINEIKNDTSDLHSKRIKHTIKECILVSKDKKETIILYFNTNKKSRNLKIPKGFFYERLCGK
jgi:hypothetical protein